MKNRTGITTRFDKDDYKYIEFVAQKHDGKLATALRAIVKESRTREWIEENSDDIIEKVTNIISSTVQHEVSNLRTLIASGAIEAATATILNQRTILMLFPPEKRKEVVAMFDEARRSGYDRIKGRKTFKDTLQEDAPGTDDENNPAEDDSDT